MYLNKTQMIPPSGASDASKVSANNERANRINLHRSNRQRSHQAAHQTGPYGQDAATKNNA